MKYAPKEKIWSSVMVKTQEELDQQLTKLKGAAKFIHLDIADGKFVPTTYLDFDFKLKRGFRYSAHLMMAEPEKWIRDYGQKIDLCIPHLEMVDNPQQYILRMHRLGKEVAFAMKPGTKVEEIEPYLDQVDYVLVLTVKPGHYGAKFMRSPLKKIKQLKKINPQVKVIVDGGMKSETIGLAKEAGGDYFVSGSFVTLSQNPSKAIKKLEDILEES